MNVRVKAITRKGHDQLLQYNVKSKKSGLRMLLKVKAVSDDPLEFVLITSKVVDSGLKRQGGIIDLVRMEFLKKGISEDDVSVVEE